MKVPERTVVVVHGIGQQAAGATAAAWAESFIRFCEAQRRRVEVVETAAADDAFSLTLTVGAPGTLRDAVVRAPVLRLRVVEARWAEAFEAPTALSVLKWLLWYGPNLAFAQVFLTRRAHRWLREATEHTIAETAPEAEPYTGSVVGRLEEAPEEPEPAPSSAAPPPSARSARQPPPSALQAGPAHWLPVLPRGYQPPPHRAS